VIKIQEEKIEEGKIPRSGEGQKETGMRATFDIHMSDPGTKNMIVITRSIFRNHVKWSESYSAVSIFLTKFVTSPGAKVI
jgi:hypothetical protein